MEWMINKNVDKDGSEQETDFVSTVPYLPRSAVAKFFIVRGIIF